VACLCLVICAAAPARADWHHGGGDCGDGCAAASGVLLGIVEVVFLGADLGYGVQGRWLPPGWAWGQTIWGTGHLLVGVVFTPLGALFENSTLLGLGIASSLLGTWFVVHGIISLVKHYRGPRRYGLGVDGPRRAYLPDVSFGPTRGGSFGSLSWTF
jgi:hypothetical protein